MSDAPRALDPEDVLEHTFDVADEIDLEVETVIVFGSVARGEADADSDVDLVLVSPDFENVEFIERGIEFEWEWDRDYGTPDVTPVTPAEFETRKDADNDVIPVAIDEGVRADRDE